MDITNENSVKFIDNLKAEGNSVQNLAPLCSEYTLKIILGIHQHFFYFNN